VGTTFGLLLVMPWLLGLGPAGLSLVAASQGNLEYRRVANAIGAATSIVEPPSVDAVQVATRAQQERAEADRLEVERLGVAADAQAAGQRGLALEEQAATLQSEAATSMERSRKAKDRQETARLAAQAERQRLESERLTAEAAGQRAETERLLAERERVATLAAQQARLAAVAADEAAAAAQVPIVADDDGGAARDLRHLPTGLAVMLVGPLPWQVDGNRSVQLAALETVVWYPLLALALVGLLAVWRHRRVLAFPLLVTGAVAVMYGLTEGNFGTAYRHRGELVWAVVVLAGVGTHLLWARRQQHAEVP